MIISHSRQFAFIHLYKTAGDAIAASLAPCLAEGDIRTDDYRRQSGLGALGPRSHDKHMSARAARAMIGADLWDRYETFSVVRHPFTRMQSLFAYARHRAAASRQDRWPRHQRARLGLIDRPSSWPLQQVIQKGADFSAFLRAPELQNHPSFRPQSEMLADEAGRMLVRRVLKFENLQVEFAQLAADLGLPETPLKSRNITPGIEEKPQLTKEDRGFIARLHHDDFLAFGYDDDRCEAPQPF